MADLNDYAAKNAALEDAKAQVERLIASLPDSPEKTQLQGGWRRAYITNIPEATAIPLGNEAGTFSINGLLWPHAKVIGPALTIYHNALKAARHAYNALAAAGEAVNPPEP
jgi:hypothetical protein